MTDLYDEYAAGEVGECNICEQRYLFEHADAEHHCLTQDCKGFLRVVYRYQLETREKAQKLISELADLCNGGRLEDIRRGLIKGIGRTHRTLQQQIWGALLGILEYWAKQHRQGSGYYDARNEYTVGCADTIMKLLHDSTHVPHI